MTDATKTTLASHLSSLRKRAGMSLDEVARAAGYKGRSSVQRYFEDHSIVTLQPAVAAKLAAALFERGSPPINLSDLARLVFEPPTVGRINLSTVASLLNLVDVYGEGMSAYETAGGSAIPIIGTAHASNWMERRPSFNDPADWLEMPFGEAGDTTNIYALHLAGNSLNKVVLDGYYAICTAIGGTTSAAGGRYVHVERSRDGLVEWTVKKVRWTDAGMQLWPESYDAEHQEPIEMRAPGFTVRIVGYVEAWFKPA